jgi:predicted nuclease of predicted toxin-antitoxin system
MRLLADLHISPLTITFLKSLGHDVIRVSEILALNASDELIIETARRESRIILTQDLDFSRLIAISRQAAPSLISLRLKSSRIEYVNAVLSRVLPALEAEGMEASVVSVEDAAIRRRSLPIP